MVPTKRYVAVGVLLVVGVLMTQAAGTAADLRTTYDAEAVDLVDEAAAIADGDPDIVDIDQWMRSMPSEASDVLRTAVDGGTYNGGVPPELHIRLDDYDGEPTIAVYDGRYYRMNATLNDDTTDTHLEFTPIKPAEAGRTVATSFDQADPMTRRAVKEGSLSTDWFRGTPGLVVRDGTYYLVTPRNEGAVVGKFLATIGGYVFNPVGYAYGVAGVALLVALRACRIRRPLDERAALGAVGGTILVMWIVATLGGTGSLALRYAVFPSIGAVAALGLLACLCFYRRAWRRLGVLTVVTPIVGVGVVAATLGTLGFIFGPLAMIAGWFGSLPLVGYGYAFGAAEVRDDGPEAMTADEIG